MVDSFLVAMTCSDCLTSLKFDYKVHPMALDLSGKSKLKSSFSMRPFMMSTQIVIISAIYSRVLFKILPCSGLWV